MKLESNILHSPLLHSDIRVLIATAVAAEKEAILRGLGDNCNVDVLDVGVGPVAAAINSTRAMSTIPYDLIICAGIAGGFAERTTIGSLVIGEKIIAADLGAQTPEGFLPLDQMGFGITSFPVDVHLRYQLEQALKETGIPVVIGPILTLSTVTGTTETAMKLSSRIPNAAAEAMEGFGIAAVANAYGVPFLEIRAISNLVGPRDRKTWQINEALTILSTVGSVLPAFFRSSSDYIKTVKRGETL